MTAESFDWRLREFAELTREELYALLRLRQDVFVVEQQCCYADIDGFDQQAVHMLIFDPPETLVGYQRLFAPGIWCDEAAISRIIIAESHRASGLGVEMVRRGVQWCLREHPEAGIRIGAQAHLENFYGRNGFTVAGNERVVDGIPHVDMLYRGA